MNRRSLFIPALAILTLDQLAKAWVLQALPVGYSVPVAGEIFQFTHVRNPGTAFGLLRGSGVLLTVVSIAAVFFIIGYWFHLRQTGHPVSRILQAGLALPLGGALGNLSDRLRFGHVIDFIDFRVWPVFNIADMAITSGAALVAYYFLVLQDPRRTEPRAFGCSGVPVFRTDADTSPATPEHAGGE
jgi:signal peptidase II